MASATSPARSGEAAISCTAACMRAAALPVGAASATLSRRPVSSASSWAARTSREMVTVLPVPGPPAITAIRRLSEVSTASRCSGSIGASSSPGESADATCPGSNGKAPVPASAVARESRSVATLFSKRQ